eukprot:3651554-Prorocentrum_lima.AAC.1
MTSSLVGSEMCIRDSPYSAPPAPPGLHAGTGVIGASSMNGGVGGPHLPVVGGGGAGDPDP